MVSYLNLHSAFPWSWTIGLLLWINWLLNNHFEGIFFPAQHLIALECFNPRFRVILIGRWLDYTDKFCSWGVKSNHKHVLKIPRKLPSIKLPPEKLPPRQTVPLRRGKLSHFFQSEHAETYKYIYTHQQSDTYIHESALWEISTSGTLQRSNAG